MSKLTKEQNSNFTFLFGRKNYIFMAIGIAVILLGFLLMMGPDANTVNGKFDVNQWNEGIFSWRRIRLAPFVVLLGFAIEVYAIWLNPEKEKAE